MMENHNKTKSTIIESHADLNAGRLPTVQGLDVVDRIHIARYQHAAAFTAGCRVLDIATGIGYGASILATDGKAQEVYGVDVSDNAIEIAKNKYAGKNIHFMKVSGHELPLESDFFDIVVSFETIEHTPDPSTFLKELKRVLKKEGTLVISTPNKRFHSFGKNRPWNPFHTIEYYPDQFLKLLTDVFGQPFFWGGQELLTDELRNILKYNWIEFQYYELRHHPSRSKYFNYMVDIKKKILKPKRISQSAQTGDFSDKRCVVEKWRPGLEPYTMIAWCKK